MKKTRTLIDLFFVLSFLQFPLFNSQAPSDSVVISRVSNDPAEGQGNQLSSLAGGTVFYIRGSGFDQMQSNNLVFLGPYQANVIGVNDAYLIFESIPQPIEVDLPLTVVVINSQTNTKVYSQCKTNCNIYYRLYITTELRRIAPRSASPMEYVQILTLPKTFTSSLSIKDIKIGPFICDRVGLDDYDYSSWSSYNKVKCRVALEMTSGYYNASLKVSQYGLADKMFEMSQIDPQGYLSDFRCMPSITNVSSNVGSPNGQIINITGYGFSSDPNQLEVKSGDYECKVIYADTYRVQCEVGATALNQSFFYRGSGLERRLYNASNNNLFNLDGKLQKLIWNKNYSALPLISYDIFNEFERVYTDDSEETYIVEVFEGYFRAPITGNYRFYLSSDDYAELYISNISNSSNVSYLNRIASGSAAAYEEPYFFDSQISNFIQLQAGQFYLINSFRNQGNGASYLTIGVEVQSNKKSPLSISSVQVIDINTDAIREIFDLKIYNYKQIQSFKIVLDYRNPQTGKQEFYDETQPISYDASSDVIRIRVSYDLGWSWPNVTRYPLFANGSVIQDPKFYNLTNGYYWQINMTTYRSEYTVAISPKLVLLNGGDNAPATVFQQTQKPSPPITGNLTLRFNGSFTFSFPANTSCVSTFMNGFPGIDRNFYCGRSGQANDNHRYILVLTGLNAPVPLLQIVGDSMQGGVTKPVASIYKLVTESNNSFYSPIPAEMLYGKSEKPNVILKSSNITGKCMENAKCDYTINADITPILQNFSLTSSGLDLILSNYQNVSVTMNTVKVKFAGVICSVKSVNLPKISCQIAKNASNQLLLEAGSYTPSVHIDNIGYAIINSSLQSQYIPLNVSSLNMTNGSSQGGQIIRISGNGFPINSKNFLTVQLGSSVCQIIDTSNNGITIKTPPKIDNSILKVSFNGQNAQFNGYQYSDSLTPIIYSLSPSTASPSQKTTLQINGAQFGSDPTRVRVFLDDAETKSPLYELSVLNVTDSQLFAVLGGGKIGSYTARIEIFGVGSSKTLNSNSNAFLYDIQVTKISPNSGSIYGGTILTINGTNFSPIKNQNQVFIGDDPNNFCDILDCGSNYIICQTRAAPSNYIDMTQTVTVTQRLQDEARCTASNCKFFFSSSLSPKITLPNTESNLIVARTGETVILNGTNLQADSNSFAVVSFVGGMRIADNSTFDINLQIKATVTSSSLIKFVMPALVEAAYSFTVYIGNKGNALINSPLSIISPIQVYGISIDDGVLDTDRITSRGGVRINITGNGFNNELVYIQGSGFCTILQNSTNWIYCVSPQVWNANITYNVTVFRNWQTSFTCANCFYTVNDSRSLYLSSHSAYNVDLPTNFSLMAFGSNFNRSNNVRAFLELVDSNSYRILQIYEGQVSNIYYNNLTLSFYNIPNNTYRLNIYYDINGYVFMDAKYKTIKVSALNIVVQSVISGYFGSGNISFTGSGFPDMSLSNINNITICGNICPVITSDISNIKCQIPKFLNLPMLKFYNLSNSEANFQTPIAIYADVPSKQGFLIDSLLSTYYDSGNTYCSVIFDMQEGFLLQLKELHYYPSTTRKIDDFYDLAFFASLDNNTWVALFTLDENIKTGWNIWTANENINSYRFYRFTTLTSSPTSRCNLAEIKFYGIKYSTTSTNAGVSMTQCDSILSFNGVKISLAGSVTYQKDSTPLVSQVSPNMGPSSGGTSISILGDGFGTNISAIQVFIDGVTCNVKTAKNQTITCITGTRSSFVPSSLNVFVNNNRAIINGTNSSFFYIDRWSDPNTWGGETPPREGDSVYIPSGQTILLDVSTPVLNAVIVEGTLIFEDKDKTFDANYLLCMEGRVQIGTKAQPFMSKLTITMHGNKDDKQLPEYGNKVWAFHSATLDMHGKPKNVTWTLLNKTAEAGDTTITLDKAVDWSVNDEIAIASTDFNHNHSESRHIIKISSDYKTLTLDAPLLYRHYAAIENYGAFLFPMKAEVALLTRNIVYQGSDNDVRLQDSYGAHLMLHMSGSTGRITYTEFRYVGQGKIIGRYPIHFHRIGDASDSIVLGNAVHNSFARVVAIHDTHFLTVQKNVGYRVYGHNYFIEDGVETNNLLEDNLGISTIQIWTLIDTDVTAATFWITNPNNIVRRNRAAGGDWFGFWYQLDNRATGPSANPDICPEGISMGIFKDNIAHSYNAFGLRIYEYVPRQFPCEDYSEFNTDDFYQNNPPVPAVFENFIAYKNFENGVMAEHIGSVEFRNFLIAESRLAGIQISQANFTREDAAKINGFLIVGLSFNNTDPDTSRYNNTAGIITPRTDNLLVTNVTFYNFSSIFNMRALESCSKCWHFKLKITGGKTTKFSNLMFFFVDKRIVWGVSTKKEVYIDLDGSLLGGANFSITAYYVHIDGIPECSRTNQVLYDDSIVCNNQVQIRPIMFRNLRPQEAFRALEIGAYRIPDLNYNMSLANMSNFTKVVMYKIFVDTVYTWALPFVTGYSYNIHWQDGSLDFTHMNIYPTNYWKSTDKGVVLRFNYSETREAFNISLVRFGGNINSGFNQGGLLDPKVNDFLSGDYYHRIDSKLFSMGLNGKINGTVDLDPVKCLKTCPVISDDDTKEPFYRLWSNVSMWNNSKLPQEGDIVVIPRSWRLILDMNTPNLARLIIDGDFTFDSTQPKIKLTAAIIWVRLGTIYAGSQVVPYPAQIVINITGTRNSPSLLINSILDTSSKIIAVTGALKLYGKTSNVIWTRLAQSLMANQSQLILSEAVDWSLGSEIVITPTESDHTQHEKRVIKNISTDGKTITVDTPLNFFHYGDSNFTYKADFGLVLDMRASVGLLTRNILITSDQQDNWGVNVMVCEFQDGLNLLRRGYVELDGVEISNGGQPDTFRASLQFNLLRDPGNMSLVQRSSIHDGFGNCLYSDSSQNITINNNVFYNCEKFLTRALFTNYFVFTRNLLVAARERNLNQNSDLYDMVAGLDMYEDLETSNITIMYNVVQGVAGNGFVIPGTVCGDSSSFKYNHVNSAKWVGLIIAKNNSKCIEASDISIARTNVGIISNFNSEGLNLKRIILAENNIGTQVMFGHEADENHFNHSDLLIMSMARPNCSSCYSTTESCSNNIGFSLPITVIEGKHIPIDKPTPIGLTSICKDSAFDQKLFLSNTTFVNYKLNYANDSNLNFRKCSNNKMMVMRKGEPDLSSPIYSTNTKAINSDLDAYLTIQGPDIEFLFWRGGCGDFNCTGQKNWLFTDVDGSLFGKPSQVIPRNPGIYYSNCQDFAQWNGKLCDGIHFGILEFQNDGPDQRKRIVAPVNITSKNMTNVLNQWREWKWEGPEPLDQRLARFNGLVELNGSATLMFETVVPEELKVKLQRGRTEIDYLIVSIKYERPNTVEVWNMVSKKLITSYRVDQNVNLSSMIAQCGANIYDSNNRTITFVLTNDDDCILKVRTVSSVQVSLRMQTTIDDFYKNSGEADFISKISAFLGLDMSRVRIVNIRSGSVIVDFAVVENKTLTNSTSAVDTDNNGNSNQSNQTIIDQYNAMKTQLQQAADKLKTGVSSGELILPAQVTDITTEIVVNNLTIPTNNTTNGNQSNNTKNDTTNNDTSNNTSNNSSNTSKSEESNSKEVIIIATSVSAVLVFLIIVYLCCFYKNKDGITMIKLAMEFRRSQKGKNESSVNQELMKTSGAKWNTDIETQEDRKTNIFTHGKIDHYTQKYLENK